MTRSILLLVVVWAVACLTAAATRRSVAERDWPTAVWRFCMFLWTLVMLARVFTL